MKNILYVFIAACVILGVIALFLKLLPLLIAAIALIGGLLFVHQQTNS